MNLGLAVSYHRILVYEARITTDTLGETDKGVITLSYYLLGAEYPNNTPKLQLYNT